uniref:Endoplasmic reticulum transmembrane protein n=1 Tax=Opuntia streptacantha TaxID=393608 RepID=A0A7C8ZBR7_OPUST
MILYIMYPVMFAEMLVILLLLFRSPLRNLVIRGLDRWKLGRGPVVAQTLMGTLAVLFLSSSYGIFDVYGRLTDTAGVNPTDQVLMAYHLLEATLLGISLFLALVIDRQHYYIKAIERLRQ